MSHNHLHTARSRGHHKKNPHGKNFSPKFPRSNFSVPKGELCPSLVKEIHRPARDLTLLVHKEKASPAIVNSSQEARSYSSRSRRRGLGGGRAVTGSFYRAASYPCLRDLSSLHLEPHAVNDDPAVFLNHTGTVFSGHLFAIL